jgi:hypothetical protein
MESVWVKQWKEEQWSIIMMDIEVYEQTIPVVTQTELGLYIWLGHEFLKYIN